MTLESLYKGVNLQDYYIGKVTQVYRSNCVAKVENPSIMVDRSKFSSSFRPNSINYFVIVESTEGVFLGEVFENKSATSEQGTDYQEICIDTVAVMNENGTKFELAGFKTLGTSDSVYLATDDIYKIYLGVDNINDF